MYVYCVCVFVFLLLSNSSCFAFLFQKTKKKYCSSTSKNFTCRAKIFFTFRRIKNSLCLRRFAPSLPFIALSLLPKNLPFSVSHSDCQHSETRNRRERGRFRSPMVLFVGFPRHIVAGGDTRSTLSSFRAASLWLGVETPSPYIKQQFTNRSFRTRKLIWVCSSSLR